MQIRTRPALVLLAAALSALPAAAAPAARPAVPAQVTIYRCLDAAGRLSLRDSPCRRGETQEVRSMLRPVDPPPHRSVATVPRTPRVPVVEAAPAQPRVVYVTPPRPMYECTTPEGQRYTSETADGNPRWVPWGVVAAPLVVAPGHGPGSGHRYTQGYGGRVEYRDRRGQVRIEGGRTWRVPGTVVGPASVYAPAGTWVRDACHALPPAEACARLQDRRDALDRRYNSALQGERDAIVREQRGIDARLAMECGA